MSRGRRIEGEPVSSEELFDARDARADAAGAGGGAGFGGADSVAGRQLGIADGHHLSLQQGRRADHVTPRELDDQLSYFEDKAKGAEPAGQKQGGTSRARARVDRRVGKQSQLLRERPIANEVAPVSDRGFRRGPIKSRNSIPTIEG